MGNATKLLKFAKNSTLQNQFGFGNGQIIMFVIILFTVPYYMMMKDRNIESLYKQNLEENNKLQALNFTQSSFIALKVQYACTENFRSHGLIDKGLGALAGVDFKPHLVAPGGALINEDFSHANSLGFMLSDLKIDRSEIKFVSTRSPNTHIALWEIAFSSNQLLGPVRSIVRTEQVPVFVETDDASKIIACRFTRLVQNDYIEDKICSTISGPGFKFEMKGIKCIN